MEPRADDTLTLVCAPADMPLVPIGAIFTHKCGECHRPVMLAQSGQQFLKTHPLAKIICFLCHDFSSGGVGMLCSDVETLLNEVKTAQPNFRRQRN